MDERRIRWPETDYLGARSQGVEPAQDLAVVAVGATSVVNHSVAHIPLPLVATIQALPPCQPIPIFEYE